MSSTDHYVKIQISQQVLTNLIAGRHLTAEQLRGLSPYTRRLLRRILLDSLNVEATSGGH
ncbi:hypothetical protein PVT68_10985 [Microbulbifer bruguierae]|uniref:Uncharacterized protein n=1 Tax=Microbulbifer bruguierae TaxID=3029061 RepID=A0ABY8NA31_9GAMM|nr:hypothetical protein [Microbulbifer bruguierae]WGL15294.1 hypothetical protein PVT68_10985 [Microbulbifer bruguierae]